MQAVTAATDVLLVLGQPLPTGADEDYCCSNWRIVAAAQRPVKVCCSAMRILLSLNQEHTKPFQPVVAQQDVPESWQPEHPPEQLQSSMLLSCLWHMQAYYLPEPASLRANG